MLFYAAVFLGIAIVAAMLGFSGIASSAAEIGKILFYVFIVLTAITLLASFGKGG